MKFVEVNSNGVPFVQQRNGSSRSERLHDKTKVRISLKQWRVLHAVIDCDGFTAAAEKLHISQSAISYTIAKMQEQLGVPLLKIEGRKAHLTQQGRALLDCSRNVIRNALELEALAEKMRLGWEPELRLMVEQDCPQFFVMSALHEFSRHAPNVRVLLQQASNEEVRQAIARNELDLAIYSHVPPGLVADKLTCVEYVPVVHSDHPLANGPAATPTELERHTCIVLGDRPVSCIVGSNMRAAKGTITWQVNDIDSALAALQAGLGYAWLPLEKLTRWLDDGILRRIPLAAVHHTRKDFYLVHMPQPSPGAGISSLCALLHEHAIRQVEKTIVRTHPD